MLFRSAAVCIERLKGNRWMEAALKAVRPVSFGMLLSVVITMSAVFVDQSHIMWNRVLISALVLAAMKKWSLSAPKAIVLAVVLGLVMGV